MYCVCECFFKNIVTLRVCILFRICEDNHRSSSAKKSNTNWIGDILSSLVLYGGIVASVDETILILFFSLLGILSILPIVLPVLSLKDSAKMMHVDVFLVLNRDNSPFLWSIISILSHAALCWLLAKFNNLTLFGINTDFAPNMLLIFVFGATLASAHLAFCIQLFLLLL